ncbi:hypothetical protein NONO_c60320 [Nocardia nova SH22a]|uniref:Uncharacterized protein n=1 Tax=Nocardia nova SH22a TaxID=1415166 RepID=W5TPD8_9NOCA|nr:hypothetical protein [Nocardia nova]AHH20808.1 hypothetical protein NONO_c60320 [Nocardia nova SH22a]
MPDLSTREQIRADAIERIARKMFEIDPREREPFDSAYLPPEVRDHYRKYAGVFVDALGDLLPTAMEGRFIGRGLARRTRYVTDWREPEVPE